MPQSALGKLLKTALRELLQSLPDHLMAVPLQPILKPGIVLRVLFTLLFIAATQVPLRSVPTDEKKLNVYTPQKTYSLQVADVDGTEYVGLFELLEPLGKLQLKANGRTFKLQLERVESEFTEGKK